MSDAQSDSERSDDEAASASAAVSSNATVQAALSKLRDLEESNAQFERMRARTQAAFESSADTGGDGDGKDGDQDAAEAHLAVLMTQLEVNS